MKIINFLRQFHMVVILLLKLSTSGIKAQIAMKYQLQYPVLIAYHLLNCLSFCQLLLPLENKRYVSLENNAKYNENNVLQALAHEQNDSSVNGNSKDGADASLIAVLNNLGLRSRKPHKLIYERNDDDEDYILGDNFFLQSGDLILHNSFKSSRPKNKFEQKSKHIGKGKKTSNKDNDYDDFQSKYVVMKPDIDDLVKTAVYLYEQVRALGSKANAKINDVITIPKRERGKHNHANDDDKEDTTGEDNSIPKRDKGKNIINKIDDGKNTVYDVSIPKRGKEKKKKETDYLFHQITDAAKTILGLVNKIQEDGNYKSCRRIIRNAKSIATLAKKRCE